MVAGDGGSWAHRVHSQEQRDMDAGIQLTFSFCSFWDTNPGDSATYVQSRSFCSVKPFWKHPHRPTQGSVSMMMLNPLKLTVKINYYADVGDDPWPQSSVPSS